MIITVSQQGKVVDVGSQSFLFCFYSTIFVHMKDHLASIPKAYGLLKNGRLAAGDCAQAAKEFGRIREVLSGLPPEQVVWDMSAPEKTPPWGRNISKDITSLGNYFVTADGKDLISEVVDLLRFADSSGASVEIK